MRALDSGGQAGGLRAVAIGAPVAGAPTLTQASVPLLRAIECLDESGAQRALWIPAERPLTVYVDKRELVTLMTLGAAPEYLVLGYLLNQRLIGSVAEIESITVDWSVEAAAVKTRAGSAAWGKRTQQRVVTTGCGQGTVFGSVMDGLDNIQLPPPGTARLRQSALHEMLETLRLQDNIHRRAGSVHGCAVFQQGRLLAFVEDVGRHNAIDTLAGWMGQHGVTGADKVFYTTGRLTSEMVMKAAHMGVPIIVSRNGVTAMGYDLAQRLGMTLFGRAANRRFLCYCGAERFDADVSDEGPSTARPFVADQRPGR